MIKNKSQRTYVQTVFVDDEHAHVLCKKFAGMSYSFTEKDNRLI